MNVTHENYFLKSALPSDAPVSTLAMPSDTELDHRNGYQQRTQQQNMRVQEQVRTMLKSSGGSSSRASSVYGGSLAGGMMRYPTSTMPNFSSKSQAFITDKKYLTIQPPGYKQASSQNWSSRSAVGDFAFKGTTAANQYSKSREESNTHYRPAFIHQTASRPRSYHQSTSYRYVNQAQLDPLDIDNLSISSMQLPGKHTQNLRKKSWSGRQTNGQAMYQRADDGEMSLTLDQVDNGYLSSGGNDYSSNYTTSYVMSQPPSKRLSNMNIGGSVKSLPRSVSGSMSMTGFEAEGMEETPVRRTIRPPAQRTLQRVLQTSKAARERMSSGSRSASDMVTMQRTASLRSLGKVDAGVQELENLQAQNLQTMPLDMFAMAQNEELDLPTAVNLLSSFDANNQVVGAGYIQHKCYHDADAKKHAKSLKAISKLVNLFNHDSVEVQRSATAAMRNLIYNNTLNKLELVQQNGVPSMMQAIKSIDEELKGNITGILWNLSSSENLKKTLAQDTLEEITEQILAPTSGWSNSVNVLQSDDDIFYNTTGYVRNLSSAKEETRQKMRECKGLVDSLVYFIQRSLDDNNGASKSVENSACILRNLSYRLYEEIPSYYQNRLEGPGRNDRSIKKDDVVGCFTPQGRKVKEVNTDSAIFSEVSKDPKGIEWLWNPAIVKLYSRLLDKSEANQQTTEAALGALQNITAGDFRWASVMSRLTMDQDRTWYILMGYLKSSNDNVLKSLTGLLRNLTLHARNKEDVSIKAIGPLLQILPVDSNSSSPSSEVAANICSILNNLVVETSEAPRQIVNHNGLTKLMSVKNRRDSEAEKAVKAASSLLGNMWYYKSMHREYRSKGYQKFDFLSN
ncbi:plakophilin-3-like isoform X1 [Scyliorhinus canicula]|uniref:plakophilin-3-like isoform X1 n=1 Tax=Scyliorhinus canicula TaxID=7830 RepID=UPI0018F77B86|nr:plakophilin-3-like isoform X1 [Scyliorhinus canicula]